MFSSVAALHLFNSTNVITQPDYDAFTFESKFEFQKIIY